VWGVNQIKRSWGGTWLGTAALVVSNLLSERVIVERMIFVRGWKYWGEALDIKFQCIGSGLGAQHLYRFWRRSEIPMDLLKWVPLCGSGSGDLPGDVLLEVRQFMASAEPCQDFELVLRHGRPAAKAGLGPWGCAPPGSFCPCASWKLLSASSKSIFLSVSALCNIFVSGPHGQRPVG
jgi:hypothetical protein